MILRERLGNIFAINQDNETVDSTIISKILLITALFLFGLTVTAGLISQAGRQSMLKSRYEDAIKEHNLCVDGYEARLSVYKDLVEGLAKRGFKDDYPTFNERDYITESIVQRDLIESNIDEISEMTRTLQKDSEVIFSHCEEIRTERYNEEVDAYNLEAESINSFRERLLGYGLDTLEEKEYKNKILVNESLWENNDDFFSDLEKILREKEETRRIYYEACQEACNDILYDFNILAKEYNSIVSRTSVDFVSGILKHVNEKEYLSEEDITKTSEDELCGLIEKTIEETKVLVENYLVVKQITNPSEDFVISCLRKVKGITGIEAVTKGNDPNGLLGKNGGYSACVYFTYNHIDSKEVKGKTIVDKGTDGGGAVEIYSSLDKALNRCDYLSQFDGTLLYSGSYAIIGTCVVRTSYALSDKEQVELTNAITMKLTEISE